MIKKSALYLFLTVAMLLICSGAWGTDYYLRYNYVNGDNPDYKTGDFDWAHSTGSWTSQNLKQGNNYIYIAVGSQNYSSFYWLNNWDNKAYSEGVTAYAQQYGKETGQGNYQGIRLYCTRAITVNLSFNGTSVTITADCSEEAPSVSNGTISVSGTTATIVGSIVTSAGTNSDCTAASVTSRGVHFTTNQSEDPMPTYSPSVTTGTGEYNTEISGLTLTAGTYYYRSFATNAHGTTTTEWSSYTFVPAQLPPAVRIGKKLKEVTTSGATQGNVDVSAYIAATGCANVTKIRVFYSNNSAFRDDEGYRSASFEKTLATPITTNNNRCDDELSITKAQVLGVVSKGETLYVRLKAVNANGLSSAYSDVAKLTYQYDQFIVENQAITATACEGQHQFKWTGEGGMFNPVPDGFEVRYNNAEGKVASSEFSLVGDYMVWTGVTAYDDNEDASPVEHVYYFTADKEGYGNVSATATFNLSAQKLDDVTVTINEGVVNVTDATIGVEPWELIELTATRSDEGTGIEWTAPEDISLTVSNNGANASVKGKKASESVYQVSARALNSTCGRSAVSVVNIKVDGIQETCTNSN